jgi:tRNA U34 2-thiouridine synthase MnmA/TrmU
MKCILLFSGGLDSMLAAKVLQRQEIEVIGLNFVTPFHDSSADAQKRAETLGIELVV